MPVSSSSSVSSDRSQWVAHDDLSETPHAEASCIRNSKADIAKWQPCLNIDLITEECEVVPVTNVELGWRSLLKKHNTRNAALEPAPAAAATYEVEKINGGVTGEEEGEDEEDNEAEAVVISRTASFANWLLARPEDVIWVATHQVTTTFTFIHTPTAPALCSVARLPTFRDFFSPFLFFFAEFQGPMRRLLEALIGAERVREGGYTKPNNAEAVAIFLPDSTAGDAHDDEL